MEMRQSNFLQAIYLGVITTVVASQVFAQSSENHRAGSYGNNPSAGSFVNVNGVTLYYEQYGTGKPLLLIHGNGQSIWSMRNQIHFFRSNYRVISPDSRGHGKSGLSTDSLTYSQMAADLAGLLESLKADSALVIGWSDGGNVGLLLAMGWPQLVDKLVIMGANLNADSAAIEGWALDWVSRQTKQAKRQISIGDTSRNWHLVKQHLNLLAHQPDISLSELSGIRSPTLVVVGDRDIIRHEHTLLIFRHLPYAQLAVLPGQTHFVPATDAVLFNTIIGRFFSSPFTTPDSKDFFK